MSLAICFTAIVDPRIYSVRPRQRPFCFGLFAVYLCMEEKKNDLHVPQTSAVG